jgi:hypothetical protein
VILLITIKVMDIAIKDMAMTIAKPLFSLFLIGLLVFFIVGSCISTIKIGKIYN